MSRGATGRPWRLSKSTRVIGIWRTFLERRNPRRRAVIRSSGLVWCGTPIPAGIPAVHRGETPSVSPGSSRIASSRPFSVGVHGVAQDLALDLDRGRVVPVAFGDGVELDHVLVDARQAFEPDGVWFFVPVFDAAAGLGDIHFVVFGWSERHRARFSVSDFAAKVDAAHVRVR